MNERNTFQSQAPQTLGRYTLVKQIGRGGMGTVWLAEDSLLHRQIALKTLPIQRQGDEEYRQRFLREAHTAATLQHPHILLVHDYGEQVLSDGQSITYIVMPLVTSGTLADQIHPSSSQGMLLPASQAISYLEQAAEAIDYAHDRGIIHRDIKPQNMLLRQNHWLLLADFGIARIFDDPEHLTETGVGIGTAEYMAPEQAQGRAVPASDIYSLVVIAYQLLAGHLPFTADSAYAIAVQHLVSPPPSPRQFNPAISPALEQALLRGLAKDPAERPTSARAFVAALQVAQANQPFTVTTEASSVTHTPTTPGASLPPTTPASQTETDPITPPKEPVGPSVGRGFPRRRLLLGGGTALVLLGGLGAWIATYGLRQTGRTAPPTSTTLRTGTPNPNEPSFILTGHTQPVIALAWSPLAPVLISGGLDTNILRWNMQRIQKQHSSSPQPEAALHDIGGVNLMLAWSPDGSLLAIGNVINADLSKAYVALYQGNLSGTAAGFADPLAFQGNSIAAALTWSPGPYLTVAMSVPASGNPALLSSQLSLAAFSLGRQVVTAEPLPMVIVNSDNNSYAVKTLAYAPTGSELAAATTAGVALIDLKLAGTTLKTTVRSTLSLNGHSAEADAITWSPDGQYLAALAINRYQSSTLDLWKRAKSMQRLSTLSLPETTTTLQTLAWSPRPGSTLLAAGSAQSDGTVFIWDLTAGPQPMHSLPGPHAPVTALAWSHDGQWLAAAYSDTQNSILLWKQ